MRADIAQLPRRIAVLLTIAPTTGCWLWSGYCMKDGYGRVWSDGGERRMLIHRLTYELLVGPIPEGLQLDHLCRIRHCANPDHLEPVTAQVNTLRGEGIAAREAKVTHCPQGHAYAGDNLYISPKGRRYCRECNRIKQRAAYREGRRR